MTSGANLHVSTGFQCARNPKTRELSAKYKVRKRGPPLRVLTFSLMVLLATACQAQSPTVGQERRLRSPEDNPILVMGGQPSDLSELITVMNRNDRVRLAQLFDSKRLVDWQVEGGKRVSVLDHDYGTKTTRVRLLEGPESGQSGWVFDAELEP